MDVQQICAVLQGCLSQNRDERNQAEALLKQVRAQHSEMLVQLGGV